MQIIAIAVQDRPERGRLMRCHMFRMSGPWTLDGAPELVNVSTIPSRGLQWSQGRSSTSIALRERVLIPMMALISRWACAGG